MGAVDIGSGAIDGDGVQPANYTAIDLANPANATGTIDTFEVWFYDTGSGVKLGTFYGSDTDYTSRDVEVIGDVTSGSKQTFSGLDCDVTAGDFAGMYAVNGRIDRSTSGGSGRAYRSGDQFGAGQQTYTVAANEKISIYGAGTAPVVLQPTGIPSAEGFGTTQLNLKLEPSGIASIEAFGAAKLNLNIALSGIVSAEAFGTPIVIGGLTIFPPAIPSAEAFGNLVIAGPLIVPGIASAEVFGNPTLGMFLVIRPSGLASVQAFGSPILIVILAKGTDMKLPPGIPGEVSIPSKKVSLPWE